MSYIYIIKNTINNKIYIGKTCKSIKERFAEHVQSARTSEYKSRRVLYQAMNKHGIDKLNRQNEWVVNNYVFKVIRD